MRTGAMLPNGQPAPNPVVYDIDGILNPASTVTALHAAGDHAICHIEVGSAGDLYTAAQEGIATTYYAQLQATGVLGAKVSGYSEYYLDIRNSQTVTIIENIIFQQRQQKGFDAVETDIDESYAATTGFPLTKAVEERYVTTLALRTALPDSTAPCSTWASAAGASPAVDRLPLTNSTRRFDRPGTRRAADA